MPPGNGGVSIGVNANTQGAQRSIAGLSQGLGKLSANAKNLFGSGSAQQLNTYNKHLNQLERNLDRVNQRLKTLQGTQSNLLQQQRQLQQGGGPGAQAQLGTIQKALQQNQRSLSFWQAKQVGGQAAVNVAQAQRPGIGGGGGGLGGWATGQLTQLAGGIGSGILKAMGIGVFIKGAADVAAKAFMTASDEQKLLSDLLPRMRMGEDLAKTSSPKGLMNNFRDMSMPLGYSGIEAMQVASAISPASNGRGGLIKDTQAAMQMARMFGIDAGGQASMLAEGGKMGGFVPGQAKRFAEMLAREISVMGLGPRAQEVQEATLTLMHRQLSSTGGTSASAAMTQQVMLAKTGVPGLQGQYGADVIAGANAKMEGSTDDASIAFQEATLRDQRGVKGYYNMRRWKEQVSTDPNALRDTIREAYRLAPNDDAAKDLISKQTGLPMTLLDKMGAGVKGGLSKIGSGNRALQMGLKGSGGLLDKGAENAMSQTGNQVRQGEATLSGVLARVGTPLVQNTAAMVAKMSTEITHLLHIADSSHNTAEAVRKLADHFEGGVKGMYGGFTTTQELEERAAAQKKYGNNPPRIDVQTGQPVSGFGVPPPGSRGPTAAQINEMRKRFGPQPPQLPGVGGIAPYMPGRGNVIKRGSADNEMHLHVHFDPHGAIHPHVKQAFIGMVGEALEHIQQKQVRGGLHHRYPRA